LSDAAIYVIVASLMIAIMFLLFMNATRRNIAKRDPVRIEPGSVKEHSTNPESAPLVYPMYVDCSVTLTSYNAQSS
jgi:flagellar basal body-associated protein FliL